MGEITYMTGAELSEAIIGYSQAVSGMTPAEAASALGAAAYPSNGPTVITSFPMEYSQGGQPVSLQAAYAAQMWNYWKTAGAAAGTTALGAAAGAAKSWASGVLFGDAELSGTLAGTGGLLTMSLPAAAAAIAPLLGVSIGSLLYNSNPELWTKISQTLLPWAYEDKQTIAAVVDENGQVYLPKDAIDAIAALFEQERIGLSEGYDSDLTYSEPTLHNPIPAASMVIATSSSQDTVTYTFASGSGLMTAYKRNGEPTRYYSIIAASSAPATLSNGGSLTKTWTHNNKTVYYETVSGVHNSALIALVPDIGINLSASLGDIDEAKVAWTIIYGNEEFDYPEGTSKWEGDSVDLTNTPTIPVIADPQESIILPYFPITLPVGDPVTTIDPLEQPDPIAPVELPQLDPYIAPVTAPEMWPEFPVEIPTPSRTEETAPQTIVDPIYIPAMDLNPVNDPSLDPDPEPAPELAGQTPPVSGGITPPIIFPVPETLFPSIVPASGSGLIHVYNPTPSEFVAFGNWLWVTYADTSIQKLWNNPFDGVIGAHELYATPSKDGTDTIKSGFLDSGISSTIVRNRYTQINCGSMVIPEYWGNYLDYSPYSKAYVYLPFIGIVEVDVDDIVGHAINILYHVDSYNGSCISQITVAKDNYTNTIYQFSGNCAVDLPLAGGSQSAIRAGLISAAAYGIGSTINGIVGGAARGGGVGAVAGGITGAVGGIANGIANVVSQKSTVQHSGSFGASYGAMGIKKPYIIIRRPIQKLVNGYQHDYGFPAHKRVLIGSCTGFLRVREVNVQSTLATDDEKKRIEELLKEGVYME